MRQTLLLVWWFVITQFYWADSRVRLKLKNCHFLSFPIHQTPIEVARLQGNDELLNSFQSIEKTDNFILMFRL